MIPLLLGVEHQRNDYGAQGHQNEPYDQVHHLPVSNLPCNCVRLAPGLSGPVGLVAALQVTSTRSESLAILLQVEINIRHFHIDIQFVVDPLPQLVFTLVRVQVVKQLDVARLNGKVNATTQTVAELFENCGMIGLSVTVSGDSREQT